MRRVRHYPEESRCLVDSLSYSGKAGAICSSLNTRLSWVSRPVQQAKGCNFLFRSRCFGHFDSGQFHPNFH